MPAQAPDYITDERERELYRDISRIFEDYCGDDPKQYSEREQSFATILAIIRTTLLPKQLECENDLYVEACRALLDHIRHQEEVKTGWKDT